MRITGVHIFAHELPVQGGPYRMASGELISADTTIVKVTTDAGLCGWGETCPNGPTYQQQHALGARAALEEIAPHLIGMQLDGINLLHRRMDEALNGHAYAKAAIDFAAHDLLGKRHGLRVAELLGGAMTEQVPSYYACGVGEPDEVARIAADRVAEGYRRIQIKVGGRPVEIDIVAVRKAYERIGDRARIAVDGNRGMPGRDAILLSNACRDIPFVLEQPCNTLDEMIAIRPLLFHPLYIDESGVDLTVVVRAVGEGLCDGFGVKITRLGGLKPAAVLRDICAVRSLPHTTDDSWGGDIISAVCAHLGATVQPRFMEGAWLAQPYVAGHYDGRRGIQIEAGHIRLPTAPGLGIEPDESLFGEPLASF